MKKLIRLFLVLSCLSLASCQTDYSINPEKVGEELMAMKAEYPYNKVKFKTNLGEFIVQLSDKTPIASTNFLRLVRKGYYDERPFYRNVGFSAIQGGGYYDDQQDYTIPSEILPDYIPVRGRICMARYFDGNPDKRSSPTEFFIVTNTEEAKPFIGQFVTFGEVIEGMEVVDSIKAQPAFFENPVGPRWFAADIVRDNPTWYQEWADAIWRIIR